MWKIIFIYVGISLSMFCSRVKGKVVLDKKVNEKVKSKGYELVSYEIDKIDKTDSTQSIFYVMATVKNNTETKEIRDTIYLFTTRDGILIEEGK